MRYLCSLITAVILGLPSFTYAQEGHLGALTAVDFSVAKVMQKAGCDIRWLSQVVADSGINPARLRKLLVGQEVFLRGGSCKSEPPDQVAGLSRMLLEMDLNSQSVVRKLQAEMDALRNSATEMTSRFEGLATENVGLKLQITKLESQLAEAKQARVGEVTETQERKGFSNIALILASLIGLVIGVILTFGVVLWLDRKIVSFASEWTIKENDKIYNFVLVGASETIHGSGVIIGKYQCPLCFEKNLTGRERNLRAHLEKHVRERIEVEVDPSLQAQATE